MRGFLEGSVTHGDGTYWSSDPRHPDRFLWIRPAGDAVEFYMNFRLSTPGFWNPDPWIWLRGTFRFTVVNGELAATDVDANGRVDAGWGVKLVGSWLVSLALAVNDADEQVTATARAIPGLLAQGLKPWTSLDRGKRWFSATSGEDNGNPYLSMTYCPWFPHLPDEASETF